MKLSKTVRTINLLVLFLCCFVARTWAQTFSVTAGLSALTIHPGDKDVAVPVSLGTDGTYSGPVTVTLTGLPSGITVRPLVLAPGASGTLLLSASVAADQEAFPASDPANADTATSTATVVAFAGAQQTTATFSLTVSLENRSFAPQPDAIDLPVLRIDTGGVAISDKTTNVPGTITITSADGHTSYLPGSAGADNTATFHLHGNSTLGLPKKAYNLKLNTSADLLTSMGLQCGYVNSAGKPVCDKSKSYVLLANYDDKTLLRDWSASALANSIPIGGAYLGEAASAPSPSGTSALMPWAPHSLFVELYLNGEYEGNYQLIEAVKIDSHRVNVTEMANTNISGNALTGGYLMEIDQRQEEDYTWVTPHGVYVGLDDPDFSPEVSEQTSYITGYVNTAEAALFSPTFTDPTTGWKSYFDEASAVNYYIVNELLGNPDGGDFYGSVYLYKDRNNPLLYMGPVWDFDISVGNASYAGVLDPTYQWTQTHSPWYAQLFADPSFKAATQQQWNNLKKNGVIANWLTSISNQAALLQQSQRNNFGRWPMQGIRVWPNPEASGSYDGEISYFQNWLALRIGYMDAFLNGQPAAKINISVPGGTLRSGTPVTLTARVTGDDPTGTVTFSYNSIVLGRADLDSTGTATLTTSSLPPGLWYIEAYYNGDSRNSVNGCLGPFVSVLRPLVQTAANLTASGTFTFGSPVTLTAAVVGVSGGSIPTGAFTFAANGISLGSATVAANGVATLTTSTIPTGNVLITATYSGDVNFASSVSNSMSATEAQGTAKVSFANLNATYSGSPQSVAVITQPSGLSYTLTYNGAASAPTAPGTYNVVATVTDPGYSGSASGTFTIAAAQSTISLSNLNATYNGSPQAVTVATQPKGLPYSISYNGLTTAPTVPGSYTVVATVTDPGYTGSTTGTLTIAKAAATVNLANLNATYSGHPQSASVTTQPEGLSYTLTYNGSSNAPTAAGSYNVVATITDPDYVGNAVATLTLAKAVPTFDWSTPAAITYGTPLSATQLSGAASIPGTITYSPPLGTLFGAGTQTISATFSPADTNDYTNLTKSVQVVVTKQATSTTLSASATSVVPNQSLAFTATVAAAQNGTPTGTVSFSDGNSVLGTAALVNGTATYSTTSLISGTHALTASYNGDGNYAPSSLGTNLVSVEVAPLAFTLASNGPSSASLDGTSSTSLSYALTPTYGAYPGQVSFTVTGLPSTLQYTITPQTVAPDAGPVNAVLTITKKTSSTANASRTNGNTAVWAILLLAPYASARSRKRLRGRMLSALLLTLGIGLLLGNTTGCGSQPAPEQMYHVAVTATTTAMQQTVMVDVSTR